MKLLKSVLCAGAMLALPAIVMSQTAEAKTMALLVGVADYNDDNGITDLLGPRNDVSILWRALKARGTDPADIAVLTDGLPNNENFPVAKGLAHGAKILAELDRLAETANKGDTVLFYYSGHGTRQPDNPAEPEDEPEADGMDQVLLPSDVGKYDPIKMALKNAIIDDVLGRKIAAIRAKGAFVWAIVDACHSGTVTRGETITRTVVPASLGIPDKPIVAVEASRGGTREGTMKTKTVAGEGGLVGFYAVDSYDQAIERPFAGYDLPMVGEADKQRMGVFTYLLHRALTRNQAQTFRDLAQEIVAELNTDATGGKVPPPVFDGDLDAPVPGSDAARLPHSVNGILKDGKLSFPVGALQGFDTGATLTLYAPGTPETVIGHAEVTVATAVTATAENITWVEGTTAPGTPTLAAVVETPAINFRFVVSPPPASDFADDAEAGVVRTALADSFKDGAGAIGIEMGEPGNPDADVLLRVKDNRLWVLRPDRPWVTEPGAYNETPSIDLHLYPESLAASLKTAVWSLARAAKLIRVTSALDSAGSSDDEIGITAVMAPAAARDPKAACKIDAAPDTAQASPVSPMLPAAAGNCDYVQIDVTNDSDIDYYIAGFYVDSLGGVAAIPYSTAKSGCVRPLPAGTGKKLSFKFWIDTWDEKAGKPSTTGAENFVILAVPKDGSGAAPRLCALTQPTLTAMQQTREVSAGVTRGSKKKLDALMNGVQGTATRGASAAAEDDGPAMSARLFVFDVKP